MSVVEPQPNPDTVAVLYDIAWRVAEAETARTAGIDRKAATLATFVSLLATLTATLGLRFVGAFAAWWSLVLFATALTVLVGSVIVAARALQPTEYVGLDSAYLDRLASWRQIRRQPHQVQGEAMIGLVRAVAQERTSNDRKAIEVRLALLLLVVGLTLIALEAATLTVKEVL